MGHDHHDHNPDRSISARFILAIILTAITLVAEIAGGIYSNSLALLSDAAHVFLDLFALLLSLAAIRLAGLPASETRTYGFHRTEVFASFINGATIFLIAVGIFYEAFQRLVNPQEVHSIPMLIIAAIGLIMNLLAAKALHEHSHHDLNVHSAFLHVLGDAAASVGVIVGGAIIYFTGWHVLDAVISIGIGGVVCYGAWRVLRDSVHILLEGVPRGLSVPEIAEAVRTIRGVLDVHHLNLWSICSHIVVLSAHIDVLPEYKRQQSRVLRDIEQMLHDRFHIVHTTLQMDCSRCVNAPMIRAIRHHVHVHHHH